MKIKEIIVVEGKDDTKKLKQFFECDTIETNGSAISNEVIEQIKHAQAVRGVIVLTDPDFAGEKIRKIIMRDVPDASHAFITRNDAVPNKKGGSLGVEHASEESIKQALLAVVTPNYENNDQIPRAVLFELGLISGRNARVLREKLGAQLKIGYTNSKQLAKRLKMFQITEDELLKAYAEITEEEEIG